MYRKDNERSSILKRIVDNFKALYNITARARKFLSTAKNKKTPINENNKLALFHQATYYLIKSKTVQKQKTKIKLNCIENIWILKSI